MTVTILTPFNDIYKLAKIYNKLTDFKVEMFDYLDVPYALHGTQYTTKNLQGGFYLRYVIIKQNPNRDFIRYPSTVKDINTGYRYIHDLQKKMYNTKKRDIFDITKKSSVEEFKIINTLLTEIETIIISSNAYYNDFHEFKSNEEYDNLYGANPF